MSGKLKAEDVLVEGCEGLISIKKLLGEIDDLHAYLYSSGGGVFFDVTGVIFKNGTRLEVVPDCECVHLEDNCGQDIPNMHVPILLDLHEQIEGN